MGSCEEMLRQYQADAERIEKRISEITAELKKSGIAPSERANLLRRRSSLKESLADIRAGIGKIKKYLYT